jgi:DNA-binding NtrC family response regulator
LNTRESRDNERQNKRAFESEVGMSSNSLTQQFAAVFFTLIRKIGESHGPVQFLNGRKGTGPEVLASSMTKSNRQST